MMRIVLAVALATAVQVGCGSSTPVISDGSTDHTTGSAGRNGTGQAGAGDSDAGGEAGGGGQMTCKTNADCGRSGGVCDVAAGVCVECLAASDCGNQQCDVTSHACVDCLANTDCPANAPTCSSGHTCGKTCAKSADCPKAQPVCQLTSHSCVECLVDADCGAGGMCQTDLTCN